MQTSGNNSTAAKAAAGRWPRVPGFELLELLGEGSAGAVFRARQVALDRDVALKVIPTSGEAGRRRMMRLLREVRLTAGLDHPVLVRGIDAGEGEGFHWFAMELVEGFTLAELVDRTGPLSAKEVLRIGIAVSEALVYLHGAGAVHRDIKPSNLMLDGDGRVRLLDLGLARSRGDPSVTEDGTALGTPQYMAPEQAQGFAKADPRMDIHNLGATLYFILCGVHAHPGRTTAEVLSHLLAKDPLPPSSHRADLPAGLDAVLLKAMARKLEDRYACADDLWRELILVRDRSPVAALPARRREPARRRAAGAVAAVALLAFGIYVLAGGGGSEGEADGGQASGVASPEETPEEGEAALAPSLLFDRIRLARRGESAAGVPQAPVRQMEDAWREGAREILERHGDAAADASGDAAAGEWPDWLRGAGEEVQRRLGLPGPGDVLSEEWSGLLEEARVRYGRRLQERSREHLRGALDLWDVRIREGGFRPSEAREALDGFLRRTGDLAAGDALEVRERIRGLEQLARGEAQRAFDRAEAEALAAIEAMRLESARELIGQAESAAEPLLAGIGARAELVRAGARAREREVAEKGEELLRIPARREPAPLAPEERLRRAAQLKEGVISLPDPGQVPAVAKFMDRAIPWYRLVDSAAGLHRTALLAIAARPADHREPIRIRLQHDPLPRVRRIQGVEDGALIVADAAGRREAIPVQDLKATVVEEILRRSGIAADPAAIAFCAYWDGDEILALEVLRRASPGEPLDRLKGMIEEALKIRRESYDHEDDRTAFDELMQIRSLLLDDRYPEAEALLRTLRARMRDARFRGGAFARRHRTEFEDLDERLRIRRELNSRFAPFGSSVAVDEEHNRVRIDWRWEDRIPLSDQVELPPDARLAPGGIRLQVREDRDLPLPSKLPAVRIALPPLRGTAGRALLSLTPAAGEPFGGVRASLGGIQVLVLGSLPDDGPFRTRAWHGLEREVFTWTKIRTFGAWPGDPDRFHAHQAPWPAGFEPMPGKEIQIEFRWGKEGVAEVRIQGVPAPSLAPFPMELGPDGIEWSGWPVVVAGGLTLDFGTAIPPR